MESSAFDEKHKSLFRFVDKVNKGSIEITRADIEAMNAAGWDDECLYYAITVCALFNFYNRWVDASGVHALRDEAHRQGGKIFAAAGYVRSRADSTAASPGTTDDR